MKKLTRAGEFTRSAYRDLLEAFLENRYTYGFFEDAENLLALESNGVEGIIIGKALYDKSFTYSQTLELLNRHAG